MVSAAVPMPVARVAFQGARGAFSEEASRRILPGCELQFEPCETFFEAFSLLHRAGVDYAVIPVENTLHGSVHENYDHLLQFQPTILAETQVRIVHNLIGRPESTSEGVRRAISHPVALAQCVEFFRRHPRIRVESHYDTGGSVKTVMEGDDPSLAAVASSAAADYYGAKILQPSIEDDHANFTRFFLLAPPGTDGGVLRRHRKTSLVFETPNRPGALFRCLAAFALRDISMSKIESRPIKGQPFEYRFYVDILGDPGEENCANAIRHLREMTESLSVLGCYSSALPPSGRGTASEL